MPINVTSTSNNMDTLSRGELTNFVNETLQLQFTKVEQMCAGKHSIVELKRIDHRNIEVDMTLLS